MLRAICYQEGFHRKFVSSDKEIFRHFLSTVYLGLRAQSHAAPFVFEEQHYKFIHAQWQKRHRPTGRETTSNVNIETYYFSSIHPSINCRQRNSLSTTFI
mmetsp:Transcript_3519/g.6446  ORF Transcript_3519/g.6446 Transcript_3519/m.6446 type:complete len:100 (+) Transcript_3519:1906-2205(+)